MTYIDCITYLEHIETAGAIGCFVYGFFRALPCPSEIAGGLVPEIPPITVEEQTTRPHGRMFCAETAGWCSDCDQLKAQFHV